MTRKLQHKVVGISVTKFHSVFGLVRSNISGKLYTPSIINGEAYCSCKCLYYTERLCSHVKTLIRLLNTNIIGESEMIPKYIPTSIKAINSLMGGLPVGSAIGVYGTPASGKSILTTQMMYEIIKYYKTEKNLKRSAMIIDTEGGSYTTHGWHGIFNKRYGLDIPLVFVKLNIETRKVGKGESQKINIKYTPEKFKRPALFVLDIRSIEKMLQLVGRSATLHMSRSGKISLEPNDKLWVKEISQAPLTKIITENKIKGLVVDSITYPTLEFGMERQNYPVRSEAIGWLMASLNNITEEKRLITFVVSHETVDPIDAYAHPEIVGGKALKHALKFTIYVAGKATSRTPHVDNAIRTKATREIWMKRHPSKAPMSMYRFIELSPEGYVDFGNNGDTKETSEDDD